MKKRREFLDIEKRLTLRQKGVRENVIVLKPEDFKDGKLSVFGFHRLKQQCEYIEYDDDIEIVVPGAGAEKFSESLEELSGTELSRVKKDLKENFIVSAVCMSLGILWFVLGQVFAEVRLLGEITLVASWVFVWTAFEKLFFGRKELRERRLNLLQILAAKVKTEFQIDGSIA